MFSDQMALLSDGLFVVMMISAAIFTSDRMVTGQLQLQLDAIGRDTLGENSDGSWSGSVQLTNGPSRSTVSGEAQKRLFTFPYLYNPTLDLGHERSPLYNTRVGKLDPTESTTRSKQCCSALL